MRYFQLIDSLMQFYAEGEFAPEAIQAKNEFFDLAGIFDEQSQNFDLKMAQFTDWYIFLRKLSGYGRPPIDHFVQTRPAKISPEDEPYYVNLASNRYSLFEFLKIKKNDLYVRDMFSDYKLTIKNSPVTYGFVNEEYFQARLIPHEDSFLFSSSFCFHPAESTKYILGEVKKIAKIPADQQKEARETLLIKLFRMRYKYEQYSHVGIQDIYSNESRLRI